MTTIELDPEDLTKALRLLHSRATDSSDELKRMLDAYCNKPVRDKQRDFQNAISALNSLNQEVERGHKRPSLEDDSEATDIEDNEAAEVNDFANDLACAVCKEFTWSSDNSLVDCFECHTMYHQECHKPPIKKDPNDPRMLWYCSKCNKNVKKIGKPMPAASKHPSMGNKVSGLNLLPAVSHNLLSSSGPQISMAHPGMPPKDFSSIRPSFHKQLSDGDKLSSQQPFKRAPPGKMASTGAFAPSYAGGGSKASGLQSSLNRPISSATKSGASTFSPVTAMAAIDKRLNNMKKAKNLKY